ncbi:nucleoporin complex subunit 54-domain-containing protein [Aspergillus pseudoustus]|uniref:Nucleoporin complex subunit 54-domain-containing protein n=1 Tax=Aspergillus pseudoustus TaxID=1810923 RepID=A0ABR4J6K8_9EURO
MSLFGGQPSAPSLFGNTAKTSPFGAAGAATGTGTQQSTGGGLFSSPQPQQSAFGAQQQQQKPLFGQTLQPPVAPSQQQQQTGTGLFGGTLGVPQQQQKPSLFGGLGGQQQQQPQQQSVFAGGLGQTQQQQQQPQQQSVFGGGLGQTQQQQQQQPQQQSVFGGSILGGNQQQGQQQQSQLGQSQLPISGLWSPGRAVTGVHRTVPMQMLIVKEKWDHSNRTSPFRTYLYNHVGEETAPFYQPGPQDDEAKWEDALRERPDSGYVPVLVHGFWELGKRAQRQKDFLSMMQSRLHEINNCLTDLLSRHDLKISVKIADCRRKHIVLSKRCLALAAKTQVLRNRGYALDDAEEELKKKLAQLERSVFDPSLNGRGEEIWARMLAIREHSKRLQAELERAGSGAGVQSEDELDENTIKIAKKILDDYHAQIQHLQKELASVKTDFEEAEKALN